MKNTVLSLIFMAGVLWGASSNATSSKDFLCAEMPMSTTQYQLAVKDCGNDPKKAIHWVCTLVVNCVFIGEETIKKSYSGLSEEDKKLYLSKLDPNKYKWLPSVLTCPGQIVNGAQFCPMPNQCKGDMYYNNQPAVVDAVPFAEAYNRGSRNKDYRAVVPGEGTPIPQGVAQ